jgi:hypothetical protein
VPPRGVKVESPLVGESLINESSKEDEGEECELFSSGWEMLEEEMSLGFGSIAFLPKPPSSRDLTSAHEINEYPKTRITKGAKTDFPRIVFAIMIGAYLCAAEPSLGRSIMV